MPEEKEIPEFYSDMFEILGGPYGVVINFRKGPSAPRTETRETVCRVRMSWEHVKTMNFVLWRYIRKTEQDMGLSYPIPTKVLSDLGIGREDWDNFWKPAPEI